MASRRNRVTKKAAEETVKTLLRWAGEDPVREGLRECMTTRGMHRRGVSMITGKMLDSFRSDARTRSGFLTFIDIRDRE